MIWWDGKASDDVNAIVEYYPAQDRPQKKYSAESVPGRNGDLITEEDAYENYKQIYNIYISAERIKLPRAARRVAEWLFAPKGYARLEDSYDVDTFRMAHYAGALDIENHLNRHGRAKLEFNCKPQRFFKTGEQPLTFTESGEIINPYQFTALPKINVYGASGALTVNGASVVISAIDEYVTLDCDTQNAYKGVINKNLTISALEFPRLTAGANEILISGDIDRIEVIPRWWTL